MQIWRLGVNNDRLHPRSQAELFNQPGQNIIAVIAVLDAIKHEALSAESEVVLGELTTNWVQGLGNVLSTEEVIHSNPSRGIAKRSAPSRLHCGAILGQRQIAVIVWILRLRVRRGKALIHGAAGAISAWWFAMAGCAPHYLALNTWNIGNLPT
jgi:hypothetical protein